MTAPAIPLCSRYQLGPERPGHVTLTLRTKNLHRTFKRRGRKPEVRSIWSARYSDSSNYLGILWPQDQDPTWVRIPASSTGCAASGRSLSLSGLQFSSSVRWGFLSCRLLGALRKVVYGKHSCGGNSVNTDERDVFSPDVTRCQVTKTECATLQI